MMATKDITDVVGTMVLSTRTAVALWKCGVLRQISCGMFAPNQQDEYHYVYWTHVKVGSGKADTYAAVDQTVKCPKNDYDLRALAYEDYGTGNTDVRDRLLTVGRLVKAGIGMKTITESLLDKLPATLEEFKVRRAINWYELSNLSVEKAERYYGLHPYAYTVEDLKADLERIQTAMGQAR